MSKKQKQKQKKKLNTQQQQQLQQQLQHECNEAEENQVLHIGFAVPSMFNCLESSTIALCEYISG